MNAAVFGNPASGAQVCKDEHPKTEPSKICGYLRKLSFNLYVPQFIQLIYRYNTTMSQEIVWTSVGGSNPPVALHASPPEILQDQVQGRYTEGVSEERYYTSRNILL